jgi:hypothetical protein
MVTSASPGHVVPAAGGISHLGRELVRATARFARGGLLPGRWVLGPEGPRRARLSRAAAGRPGSGVPSILLYPARLRPSRRRAGVKYRPSGVPRPVMLL